MRQSSTLERPLFVDLNVLPEEFRPRRYPPWFIGGVITVLALSLLLLPLARVQQATDEESAHLQAELALINDELGRLQIDLGEARHLRQQLADTEAAIAGLNEERQAVLGDRQGLSDALAAMMRSLPPGARVESVGAAATDSPLSLTGHAGSAADVLEYSRSLVATGRFSQARVTSLASESDQEDGGGVAFIIEVGQ